MTTTEPRPLKDWEAEHANRLVESINTLRERYGWTIPRLRSELEPFGWTPSLETLNGILSARKRKSFSVAEVLAFARALSVSPAYLIAGLPSSADLPSGPVAARSDVPSFFEWVADSEFHALGGSALGPMSKYASELTMARWHNALWVVSGERGVGAKLLDGDLRILASARESWRGYVEARFNVPELPPLPPELQGLGIDDGELVPLDGPLPESFSGATWIAEARAYIDRLDASKAELEDMQQRGGLGGPAANPSE